ncbi:MAG: type II secretion system F family protein [Patescibacteria group bacterium]
MAKFKYTARTKEGELQAGFVEAPAREVAADILSGHDLFVLSVESSEIKRPLDVVFRFFNRVKIKDLMIFTRQFSILLESGVPLGDSLRNLHQQTKNFILKEAVYEIFSDVTAGLSLSQALEKQGNIFGEFYISMVRSAEITGRLEGAMAFLADYLEREAVWRASIRNSLIYPLFILGMFVVVGIGMITFVFPQLISVFDEANIEMPLLTRVFLQSGTFLIDWWWLVIIILIVLGGLIFNYSKSEEGKNVIADLTIKLPIFGNLLRKIYVARFAESVSVLIKGGIPITQALKITSNNIGNLIYRDVLYEIGERVKAGESFSALLYSKEKYFPSLVSQMVAIGETTGRLDVILSKISVFYSREVNNMIDNLTELIQPILISIVGIFVGLLFAAILIPIYNLMTGGLQGF